MDPLDKMRTILPGVMSPMRLQHVIQSKMKCEICKFMVVQIFLWVFWDSKNCLGPQVIFRILRASMRPTHSKGRPSTFLRLHLFMLSSYTISSFPRNNINFWVPLQPDQVDIQNYRYASWKWWACPFHMKPVGYWGHISVGIVWFYTWFTFSSKKVWF